jgi:signal peptidase I
MKRKTAITEFGTTLILVLGILVFALFNFKTVVVTGPSMEPTFHDKQRLLACKAYWLIGPVKKKDIVVIKGEKPGDYFIKRVYALDGEVVDWANVPDSWSLRGDEYRVEPGKVYVLGDNREVSEDSRAWGAIPLDRIIGKIVKR